jgi:hypothetical protein
MLSFTRAIWIVPALFAAFAASSAEAKLSRAPAHVVELFTAQGCTGCPQANQAIAALVARKDLLVLTYPVDYWDYLGWKDTFAQPDFTNRQNTYKSKFRLREIYTPQFVIDGRKEGSGLDQAKLDAGLKSAVAPSVKVSLSARQLHVTGAAPSGGADVWLVRYDPSEQTVQVKAGENRGKTVSQQNVVRKLVKLGRWKGGAGFWALKADADSSLKTVVLVQSSRTGEIIGAGR